MKARVFAWLGIEANRTSLREKLLAGGLGGLGIAGVAALSLALAPAATPWLIASVSASAVLLFAVPHGAFSQPWPLLAGHGVSALIGVTCAQWLGHGLLAVAVAAGLALFAMYQLRCIHPPGGATALSAVLGGPDIQALGYGFVLMPVLLNMGLLMSMALLLNAPFPWRRYPAALRPPSPPTQMPPAFSAEDIAYALRQLETVVAVSDEELNAIFTLAQQHARQSQQPISPAQLQLGHYYSNGAYGDAWEVRQLVDGEPDTQANALLIYQVVAGTRRRATASLSRAEFAQWARYEVYRDENTWKMAAISAPTRQGGGSSSAGKGGLPS